MRREWILVGLVGIWLVMGVAVAQTPTASTKPPATTQQPPTTAQSARTPSTAGTFDTLSPRNQQIARALFEAQKPGAPSGTTAQPPAPTTPSAPLTLDQIAAMKLSGKRWGEVFKLMKSRGLIRAKDLGQVVRRSARAQWAPAASSKTTITTGGGRTQGAGRQGKPEGTGSGANDGQESGASGAATGVSGRASSPGAAGGDGEPGSFSHGGGRGR